MAAVPVEIRGTEYDLLNKTQREVFIVGQMGRSDLSVGGGPVYPPGGDGGTGIWGPTDPRPSNPIPIYPGGTPNPPVIWGPNDPRPTPPIYLPPDTQPPPDLSPGGDKPPPEGAAGWGYYDGRWGFFPGPADAGPKSA